MELITKLSGLLKTITHTIRVMGSTFFLLVISLNPVQMKAWLVR